MAQTRPVPVPALIVIVLLVLVLAAVSVWFLVSPNADAPQPVVNEPMPVARTPQQPEPAPQKSEPDAAPAPVPTEDTRQTMPVRWMTQPLAIPAEGIPFRMSQWPGGKRHDAGTVFTDKVRFNAGLPDGGYTWIDETPLQFARPVRGDVRVNVAAGRVEITGKYLAAIPLYYTVPVRLRAQMGNRPQLGVSIQHQVEGGDPNEMFHARAELTVAEERTVEVARGKLVFWEAQPKSGGLQLSTDLAAIESSLGDRVPEPHELIVLKPRRDTELLISVTNQQGWLRTALPMSKPEEPWSAKGITFRIKVDGWLARGELSLQVDRPGEELVVGSAEVPSLDSFSVLLPPLAADSTIGVELSALRRGSSLIESMGRGTLVATGQTALVRGQARYAIELMPYRTDGEVSVIVKDDAGRARPYVLVELEGVKTVGSSRTRVPFGQGLRTNVSGEVVFSRVPIVPHISITACVRILWLRDNRRAVSFQPGETRIVIEFVVPADTLQPLAFQLVPDALSEKDRDLSPVESHGMTVRKVVPVEYSITSYGGNSGHDKSGKVSVTDDWLLCTDYVQPGRYSALLETPFGEYVVEGHHSKSNFEPVRVILGNFTETKVTCVNEHGTGIHGVVIFTASADAAHAWGNAAGRAQRVMPSGAGLYATNKEGGATLIVAVGTGGPSDWRYVHPEFGLMLVKDVSVDPQAGYRVMLKVDIVTAATLTVKVDGKARQPGLRYHVTVRIPSPGDIVDARTSMGWMRTIEDGADSLVFAGVPPGTYEVKVYPTTGTGIMTPPDGWHTRIELKAGEPQTIVFPKS